MADTTVALELFYILIQVALQYCLVPPEQYGTKHRAVGLQSAKHGNDPLAPLYYVLPLQSTIEYHYIAIFAITLLLQAIRYFVEVCTHLFCKAPLYVHRCREM